ncbi:MAG: protein of unknown function YeeE/YedE [Gemmatimonadetes bacterium]|nr:protein of unknown function YeeE/YedE [Gemmatimonadota bacterium]
MIAPFSEFGLLGEKGVLAAGLVVGVAFGVCLERAGLGSAKKLMGQFHLTDLAVIKVMFSAIVTAMLGLFWLSRLGLLDLRRVYLPDTFLLPQLVGGALFGLGLAVAGLCPGTACVAAATGRGDGVAVVAGMLLGVLATGSLVPAIASFYLVTARGAITVPSLLGVQDGVIVLAVVVVALVVFLVGARAERWAARRSSTS